MNGIMNQPSNEHLAKFLKFRSAICYISGLLGSLFDREQVMILVGVRIPVASVLLAAPRIENLVIIDVLRLVTSSYNGGC